MAGQGSARVILNEIDLSQVSSQQQLPQGVPAAVIGPAMKGPAFVPKTFANMQQFNSTFGSVNNTTKDGNGNLNGPLGVNEWMKNANAVTYVRTLGIGDGTSSSVGAGFNLSERQYNEESGELEDNRYALTSSTNTGLNVARTHVIGTFLKDADTNSDLIEAGITNSTLSGPVGLGMIMTPQGVTLSLDLKDIYNAASYSNFNASTIITAEDAGNARPFGTLTNSMGGYEIGKLSDTHEFTMYLTGFKNSEETNVIDLSLDSNSSKYFAKVLNTDPDKFQERGHYLYMHSEVDLNVYKSSTDGLLQNDDSNPLGSKVCFIKQLNDTPLTNWNSRFTNSKTPWITSQIFDADSASTLSSISSAIKLFRLHAIDDGAYGNDKYRLLVSDVLVGNSREWSSFTLSLEKFDSDPINGEKLVSWKNCNLDPDSNNFIGRLVGDMHTYWDFSVDPVNQTLFTEGNFPVKNDFVRIEISDEVLNGEVPKDTVPFGFYAINEIAFAAIDLEERGPQMISTTTDNDLSALRMMPIPVVNSIVRKVSSEDLEVSTSLPWGVKFGKKKTPDGDFGELSDKEFNYSLATYTKFFPEAALLSDNDSNILGGNYFNLQKIECDIAEGSIDWTTAVYRKNGVLTKTRFVSPSDATTKNVKFMKFRLPFFGGFDGTNIFSKSERKMTNTACVRDLATDQKTGPTIELYKKAVDTLSDRSSAEFQLLAIPGIRCRAVTDYALNSCENRFDAMYIMDIEEYDENSLVICDHNKTKPHVRNTISMFSQRKLDSSFGSAYFPNVVMNKPSSQSMIEVPPTVSMLGAISLNDSLKDPWFAPAGLTRGRVTGTRTTVNMNIDVLNDLYDADINPLYVPSGRINEVYAFGQKTLLQDSSALDRINVRRLLISLRRQVKDIATSLLFEPNRASTLQKFNELVEPILLNVKKREGVERYKVQIDTTTTTQNDIENNTIRGKIYIQPTKSVEFISLDFVVSNSID